MEWIRRLFFKTDQKNLVKTGEPCDNPTSSTVSLDDSSYVMVAAIDFGTTFSGYAFSFKNEKYAIKMNNNWGDKHGYGSYKTPTCVLTDGNSKFVAFGYDAEELYSQTSDDDEDGSKSEYHLFKHFKMKLHNEEKLTRTTKLTSTDGEIAPALDIFTMALKYLKHHLLNVIRRSVSSFDESLIKWVLTVPAIWREEAKQFMREAAFQAGLIPEKDSRQLCICLEPEAASILCRNIDVSQFAQHGGDAKFRKGTKYIVVDAGGGTVDITVHEVLITGNVKELHRANGGPWGGSQVDQNFVKLLGNILGSDFINEFKLKHPSEWLKFMISFEKKKRGIKPCTDNINMDIPYSMPEMFIEKNGEAIGKAIKAHSEKGVGFSRGVITFKPKALETLFKEVTQKIASHLKVLITSSNVRNCSYLLLVGGFAESEYLQVAVKEVCERNLKMLVPTEAQLAVIKGAVLFGHKPNSIESRVARKTYGTGSHEPCKEGEHDERYTCTDKFGKLRYLKFWPFVVKDEEVRVGSEKTQTSTPVYPEQTSIIKDIFCTYKKDAKYSNEEGVIQVGILQVEMPNIELGLERELETKFIFGGTEIEVHATEKVTGNTAKIVIDFLSG